MTPGRSYLEGRAADIKNRSWSMKRGRTYIYKVVLDPKYNRVLEKCIIYGLLSCSSVLVVAEIAI